ncbi:hypothetical protein K432DRAFT_410311 [Lepidopterella palustris CBS 459.81]|uniref:Uncharacterized protein n=1 Tax=Lepidopterella palustris CBS 459.81 TaxID=1314670 RepID=A0A8E2J942_9PEZI|nr:hypothetical protein K432DRAFT_410311 [Lepidopterella palustris CBS 459.81]
MPTPGKSTKLITAPFYTSLLPSLDHITTFVVRSFAPDEELAFLFSTESTSQSRICGAWVEVLPMLVGNGVRNSALIPAVKALAVSILTRGPNRKASVLDGVHAHVSALRPLREAIHGAGNFFQGDLATAIMCLLLAELILPISTNSWITHTQGISKLIQLANPDIFLSGTYHKLFVGFRPGLVVLAFMSRKATFLALDDWVTVPFTLNPPRPIQALLSEVVVLPQLLEQLDEARYASSRASPELVEKAAVTFLHVLQRLELWMQTFSAESPAPLFSVRPSDHSDLCIWFPSVSVANSLTHFWAFRAMCLMQVRELGISFPDIRKEKYASMGITSGPALLGEAIELSRYIYQSTEFLMQDDMKLFGPSSVIFPLKEAYEILKVGGKQSEEDLRECRKMLDMIRRKGFHFPMFSNSDAHI